MSVNLDGYVDVAERLRLALDKYPELHVSERVPELVTIGDRAFIQVTVEVRPTPATELPITATAWEPFPGRTPYTRDSEMMNASTSALGRALGFLGFGIKKSIASANEVLHRQDDAPAPVVNTRHPAAQPAGSGGASPAQLNAIRAISKKLSKLPPANLDELDKRGASDMIQTLQAELDNASMSEEEPF